MIFAIDTGSGEHLWQYQGKSISHHTVALGPDRVFFIDSSITQRATRGAAAGETKRRLRT